MKQEKLPWMQFDVTDWLVSRSVQLMTRIERSIYIDLLCYQWRDGSVSADLEELALILHVPFEDMEKAWIRISKNFEPHPSMPGQLVNMRLHQEAQNARDKRETNRQNVAKRWDKQRGQPAAPPAANPPKEPAAPAGLFDGDTPVEPPNNGRSSNREEELDNSLPNGKGQPAADESSIVMTPYAIATRVLTQAHAALGWQPPQRRDIQRQLRPIDPIPSLVAIYGEKVTAELFVLASTTWRTAASWTGVCDQRNQLHEQLTGKRPATRQPANRETLAEAEARLLRELSEQDNAIDAEFEEGAA